MARTPNRFPIHHGPDLPALLAGCHADFDDDTPRLVLADWLQEHDDPRAEVIRLQCRLAAMPAGAPEYDALFGQHQKWWKKHRNLWEKEAGQLIWDDGPHDRGLPTVGNYDEDYCGLNADELQDPLDHPKDRLSATIAAGWPGMTWVYATDPLFDDDELSDGDDDISCALFHEPPWVGSPTPIGICFPDGAAITPEMIDEAAQVPRVRGLSLAKVDASPNLLPRIAKIRTLTHLDLGSVRLDDAGLKVLAPLKHLRSLIAPAAAITNAGAAALAKFAELRVLKLGTRRLTGAGHQSLARLTKLEVLELAKADDATVRHLAPLQRLRRLNLNGTSATGRGLDAFPLLTHLDLEATAADDAGAACFARLPRLQYLELGTTRVTGAALPGLAGLRWLSNLDLSQTAIGNRDLGHLQTMPGLELVCIWGSKVTTAAKNQLRKKLKNVSVI